MKKKIIISALLTLILSLSGFFFLYMRDSMDSATVIRKLQGLRVSAEFFKSSIKRAPNDFNEIIMAGNLEEIPKLKLKWRFASKKVLLRDDFKIKNTGSWVYV
ncbi:MAG: hypothetical protein KAJ48_04385, partial [Elusimicrobiales bacterium]|nr:hypothetical protein [Elusimicrobiales bacterium]